jgi:hypothetical protein
MEHLANPPFVSLGGGGSSSGGAAQAFTYVATGAEGSDFFITLPVAQANDNYIPSVSNGGVADILIFDMPDIIAGDRTTTQFRIITSASIQAGDRLDVLIFSRT